MQRTYILIDKDYENTYSVKSYLVLTKCRSVIQIPYINQLLIKYSHKFTKLEFRQNSNSIIIQEGSCRVPQRKVNLLIK